MRNALALVRNPANLSVDGDFVDGVWKSRVRSGEQRLMLAILNNALDSFFKYRRATDEKGKAIFQEVAAWIGQENNDWIFSFENVCESVGINASYLRAELHRLRGEFAEAAEAYRGANELGRAPQPGLALLRLAQGRLDAAVAAVHRVLDEAQDPLSRSRVLAPYVEIVLAAGDVGAGRDAAEELSAIAAAVDSPFLRSLAASVTGAVLLAEGEPRGALASLRRAWTGWRHLEVPYEAARVRVLIALACRGLDDDDGGEMELDAARSVFEELGAAPDLARTEELSRITVPRRVGGLTAREVEVLALVATGRTNRAISVALGISEKTVARHVSDIFTRLGLSSRAAATAYAYQHHLVQRDT